MTRIRKLPEFNYLVPPKIADIVEETFKGPVDLDPCAHPQQFVKAAEHCYGSDPSDDGMLRDWSNKTVWLNPNGRDTRPKMADGRPATLPFEWHPITQWITKASMSARMGSSILAFLPAATENLSWFHPHIRGVSAMVLLEGRVTNYIPGTAHSLHEEGVPTKATQPNIGHLLLLWTQRKDIYLQLEKAVEGKGFFIDINPPEGL